MTKNYHFKDEPSVDEWQFFLEPYKANNCEMALKEWMYSNRFPPKPMDIKELCEEIIYAVQNPIYDVFEIVSLSALSFTNPSVRRWVRNMQDLYKKQKEAV